jgi:hypothetical protein
MKVELSVSHFRSIDHSALMNCSQLWHDACCLDSQAGLVQEELASEGSELDRSST